VIDTNIIMDSSFNDRFWPTILYVQQENLMDKRDLSVYESIVKSGDKDHFLRMVWAVYREAARRLMQWQAERETSCYLGTPPPADHYYKLREQLYTQYYCLRDMLGEWPQDARQFPSTVTPDLVNPRALSEPIR